MKTGPGLERVPMLMGLAALMTLLWGSGLAGCTLVYPCGAGDSEYCVGDDCQCGSECTSTDDDCSGDDGCVAYQFEADHGVCLDRSFMQSHDLVPKDLDYQPGAATEACSDYCEACEGELGLSECGADCGSLSTAEDDEWPVCLRAVEDFFRCLEDGSAWDGSNLGNSCFDTELGEEECEDEWSRVQNNCPEDFYSEI